VQAEGMLLVGGRSSAWPPPGETESEHVGEHVTRVAQQREAAAHDAADDLTMENTR
jgi:hypothetical protein